MQSKAIFKSEQKYSLRCVRSFVNALFSRSVKMNSRKFTKLVCALFIAAFCNLFTSTSQSTLSLGDGNVLEVPDEPKYYCNLDLRIAVRKFCREKVIQSYREQQVDRSLPQRSAKKCGQQLMDKCCLVKCTVQTFVNYCPYRYHRWCSLKAGKKFKFVEKKIVN